MEKEHFEILLENIHSQVMLLGEGQQMLGQQMDRRFAQVDQRFSEVDQRFDEVDRRFSDIHRELTELKVEVREIKRPLGLLQVIANDHEERIQSVEHDLKDHLDKHQ